MSPACKDCCDFKKKIQDMKNTLLLQAARSGHVDCLKEALRQGADVNATEICLEDTAKSVFNCLLQFDVPLGTYYIDNTGYPVYGNSAIGLAVVYDQKDCLELLIKEGADVNSIISNGQTLLMYAAHNGNLSFVNLLIEAGADVNAQSGTEETGDTALILASQSQAPECVKSLIAAGADLNKCGQNGNTALIEAIQANGNRCVELLIQSGADVNIKKRAYQTALFSAVGKGYSHYVEQLVNAGADVNYRASLLLYFAANKGILATLQALFRVGIPNNTPPPYVLTGYLKIRVKQRQTDVVLILGEKIDKTKVPSVPEYLKP